MPESVKTLGLRIARMLAWNLGGYREVYARFGASIAALAGKPFLGAEMYLRGLCYRSLTDARELLIGRNVIVNKGRGNITLGNRVRIGHFCYVTTDTDNGYIKIGDNSHIDCFSALYGQGGLIIGENCAIGAGTMIHTQTNQYTQGRHIPVLEQPIQFAPVSIGAEVWLGAGVRVLPGASIGNGAVVGAGAVVRGEIPEYSVAVGVPAKTIRTRD